MTPDKFIDDNADHWVFEDEDGADADDGGTDDYEDDDRDEEE